MSTEEDLSKKLIQISLNLKLSQAFVYDPSDNSLTLATEYTVPSQATAELTHLVKSQDDDEFMRVKRFIDEFKITFFFSTTL